MTKKTTLEKILELQKAGITNNAEIARRLGVTRQRVWLALHPYVMTRAQAKYREKKRRERLREARQAE